MMKFYHKKEMSQDEAPILLLERRHTFREIADIKDDETRRAERSNSVDSSVLLQSRPSLLDRHQLTNNERSNSVDSSVLLQSRPSLLDRHKLASNERSNSVDSSVLLNSKNRQSLLDKHQLTRQLTTSPPNLIVTESELASSKLFLNKKAQISSDESANDINANRTTNENPRSPRPVISSTADMERRTERKTRRPRKFSICCYVGIVFVIALIALGVIIATGGIVYMEVFSSQNVTLMERLQEVYTVKRPDNSDLLSENGEILPQTEIPPFNVKLPSDKSRVLESKESELVSIGSSENSKILPQPEMPHFNVKIPADKSSVLVSKEGDLVSVAIETSTAVTEINFPTEATSMNDPNLNDKEDNSQSSLIPVREGDNVQDIPHSNVVSEFNFPNESPKIYNDTEQLTKSHELDVNEITKTTPRIATTIDHSNHSKLIADDKFNKLVETFRKQLANLETFAEPEKPVQKIKDSSESGDVNLSEQHFGPTGIESKVDNFERRLNPEASDSVTWEPIESIGVSESVMEVLDIGSEDSNLLEVSKLSEENNLKNSLTLSNLEEQNTHNSEESPSFIPDHDSDVKDRISTPQSALILPVDATTKPVPDSILFHPVVESKAVPVPLDFLKRLGFEVKNTDTHKPLTAKDMQVKFSIHEALKFFRELDENSTLPSSRQKSTPRSARRADSRRDDTYERKQYLSHLRHTTYDD